MNRYLDALIYLSGKCHDNYDRMDQKERNNVEESEKRLQELVDKEKPIKVKWFVSPYLDNIGGVCPKCEKGIDSKSFNYCPYCGRRIKKDE